MPVGVLCRVCHGVHRERGEEAPVGAVYSLVSVSSKRGEWAEYFHPDEGKGRMTEEKTRREQRALMNRGRGNSESSEGMGTKVFQVVMLEI